MKRVARVLVAWLVCQSLALPAHALVPQVYVRASQRDISLAEQQASTVGGQLNAAGNLTIVATGNLGADGKALAGTGDITVQGARISSETAAVALAANNNVNIVNLSTLHHNANESASRNSGLFKSSSSVSRSSVSTEQIEQSSIAGNSVAIDAGRDILVQGSNVIAVDALRINAGRNLSVVSVEQHSQAESSSQSKQSGLFANYDSGVASIGYNKSSQAAQAVINDPTSSPEQVAQAKQTLVEAKQSQTDWGTGGDYNRALNVVTGLLVGGVAGQGSGQLAANASAPYAAAAIGDYFKTPGNENQTLQNLSHAVLGATLAYANGSSALGGALAAGGAELAAQVLTKELYPEAFDANGVLHRDKLTPTQARNITALTSGIGALLSGVAGVSLTAAATGGRVATNAVENNYLNQKWTAFNKPSEQAQFDAAVVGCTNGTHADCVTRDSLLALSQARDRGVGLACAGGPSSDCGSLVRLAQAGGNTVNFGNNGEVYIYPVGTPVVAETPTARAGSFNEQVSNSTLDAVLLEVGNGAARVVVGAAVKGLRWVAYGTVDAAKVVDGALIGNVGVSGGVSEVAGSRAVSVADTNTSPLFRGTSDGYPGNSGLQAAGVTPTSTNPAVSTVFGSSSSTYGNGVVHVALPGEIRAVDILPGNVLARSEAEVGVNMTPTQFANTASVKITVDQARGILQDMGINIPANITLKGADLTRYLESLPTMTSAQIDTFVQKAVQISKGN